MKPNTLHAVFTTEHSIALGGHFYSTSNIQDSFFAIVHCFMGNFLVTNVEHCRTRILLLRMMQYFYKCLVSGVNPEGRLSVVLPGHQSDHFLAEYSNGHIPNMLENDSLIDALTLCNFCILANVLDFRTYSFPTLDDHEAPSPREYDQRAKWDYNALSVVDREHFTYTRGLARNFISWIGCNYDVTYGQATEPVVDFERHFAGRYLHQQCCAILNYKEKATGEGLSGLRFCKASDVERQMDLLFGEEQWACYGDWAQTKLDASMHGSLAFGDRAFTIKRKEKPLQFKGRLSLSHPLLPTDKRAEFEPTKLGKTRGDKLYSSGTRNGFLSSKSNRRPLRGEESSESDTSSPSESESSEV